MTDVAGISISQGASAKQLSRLERNEKLALFAFLLPTLALLGVFFLYPRYPSSPKAFLIQVLRFNILRKHLGGRFI